MDPSDRLVDSSRRRPIQIGTVLLLLVILVLGLALIMRQRREARLRAALADYQSRSRREIVRILGRRVAIDWPEGTTLEDAIKLIKSRSTRWWVYSVSNDGVSILVDPDALRRAGKTLESTVKGLPPDPDRRITLRQMLRSVLEPMGLAYEVLKDGTIMITTPDAIDNPDIEEPEDEGIAP